MMDSGPRRLRERRRAVGEQRALLDADLERIGAERSSSTSDDEHDPEGSTLSSDWSRLTGLVHAADEQLRLVDAALSRVADGSYGRCLGCGGPIGEARLEVRPEAELCIACASEVRR